MLFRKALVLIFFFTILISSSFSFSAKTNLTAEDVECYYSEEFTINTKLFDENNVPLSNEKINIIFDNWTYNLTTNHFGETKLTIPYDHDEFWYDVGIYNFSVYFAGNGANDKSVWRGKINILPMPTFLNMKYEKNLNKLVFHLVDFNNNPVGAGRIDLYINGKHYSYVITKEYGRAYADISDLKFGEHNLVANNYEMRDNYITDEIKTIISVNNNEKESLKNDNLVGYVNMKNASIPYIIFLISLCLLGGVFKFKRHGKN